MLDAFDSLLPSCPMTFLSHSRMTQKLGGQGLQNCINTYVWSLDILILEEHHGSICISNRRSRIGLWRIRSSRLGSRRPTPFQLSCPRHFLTRDGIGEPPFCPRRLLLARVLAVATEASAGSSCESVERVSRGFNSSSKARSRRYWQCHACFLFRCVLGR